MDSRDFFSVVKARLFVLGLSAIALVVLGCAHDQSLGYQDERSSQQVKNLAKGDSPYDWRGLTIEPSETEPPTYEAPAYEDSLHTYRSSQVTLAPENPRLIAEWENIQAAVVRYPLGISVETVKLIASELQVYVLCSFSDQTSASNAFKKAGAKISNITFITCVTDSYWTRDYCPLWLESGPKDNRKIQIVDATCRMNGERPNDDKIPLVLASYLNLPSFMHINYICQGGNFMVDGQNTASSTDRVKDENISHNISKIMKQCKSLMGVNSYFIVEDPSYPGDYIRHIDCWAKFIPGNKILVKRVPSNSADYLKYETAAKEWAGRTNAYGDNFEVIRVDGPEDASYCNHVVLNDRVFVPIKEIDEDETALKQIQAAYGSRYRVFGVVAPPNAPWLRRDSIHCRISSVPVLE